ncbi:MAG: hypothetical protein H6563_07505 [Lewinellaceae bacterium]|nr:hypothetical protein [Lewinellaceae bacterium]
MIATLNPGKLILPFFALLALTLISACQKDTVDPIYLPEVGHQAISFTHKFNPADYEEGKRIVVEEFSVAIENSGQVRRTYFMSNPDSAEVYAISFFDPGSSTTEWAQNPERQILADSLAQLAVEPVTAQQYTLELAHDSN